MSQYKYPEEFPGWLDASRDSYKKKRAELKRKYRRAMTILWLLAFLFGIIWLLNR